MFAYAFLQLFCILLSFDKMLINRECDIDTTRIQIFMWARFGMVLYVDERRTKMVSLPSTMTVVSRGDNDASISCPKSISFYFGDRTQRPQIFWRVINVQKNNIYFTRSVNRQLNSYFHKRFETKQIELSQDCRIVVAFWVLLTLLEGVIQRADTKMMSPWALITPRMKSMQTSSHITFNSKQQ